MAAPSYVDDGGIAGAAATTISVYYPSAVSANDIAIAVLSTATDNEDIVADDSGWTEIHQFSNAGQDSWALFWRRCDGSEDGTTDDFSRTVNTGLFAGLIHTFSGCITSGTPYEGLASTGGAGNTVSSSSITPTDDERHVCVFHCINNDVVVNDFTGNYVTRTRETTAASTDGALGLSSFAQSTAANEPARTASTTSNPQWGTFTLALLPVAAAGTTVNCTKGAITVAEKTPVSVTAETEVSASLGTVAVAEKTPATINAETEVSASLGTLSVAGYKPALPHEINTSLGTVTVTGHKPALPHEINASKGAVTVTDFNPTVTIQTTVSCSLGTVVVAGYNPAIEVPTQVDAGLGTLAVAGYGVTLPTWVGASKGTLEVQPRAPDVWVETEIRASLDTVTVAGYDVQLPVEVNPSKGAISVAGFDVDVTIGVDNTVNCSLGTVTVADLNASINAETLVSTTPDNNMVVAGYDPDVTPIIAIDVASEGQVRIDEYNPTVTAETEVSASAGAVTVAGFNPTINVGAAVVVTCKTAGAVTVAAYDSLVIQPLTIYANCRDLPGKIVALGKNPQVLHHIDIADIYHPHVPGTPTLTHVLPVQDAIHQHVADNLTLTYEDWTEGIGLGDAVWGLQPVMKLPPYPFYEDEVLGFNQELFHLLQAHYIPQIDRIENMTMVGLASQKPDATGRRQLYYATDDETLYIDVKTGTDTAEWFPIAAGSTASPVFRYTESLTDATWEEIALVQYGGLGEWGTGMVLNYAVIASESSSIKVAEAGRASVLYLDLPTDVSAAVISDTPAQAGSGGDSILVEFSCVYSTSTYFSLRCRVTATGFTPSSIKLIWTPWTHVARANILA